MWKYFRFFNLDVLVGVAGFHLLICSSFHLPLDLFYFIFILFITNLIYIADRIFEDNPKKIEYSELHRWHKRYFRFFAFLALLSALITLWSFSQMHVYYRFGILIPSLSGLTYYLGVRFYKATPWMKDVLISLTYTLAITLPLWVDFNSNALYRLYAFSGIFILAFLNMVFTSLSVQSMDALTGEINAFQHEGFRKEWKKVIGLCLVILVVMAVGLWLEAYLIVSLVFCFGGLSFLFLLAISEYLENEKRFILRYAADLVLMMSFPAYLLNIWLGFR